MGLDLMLAALCAKRSTGRGGSVADVIGGPGSDFIYTDRRSRYGLGCHTFN
jgi:hypothetical protein